MKKRSTIRSNVDMESNIVRILRNCHGCVAYPSLSGVICFLMSKGVTGREARLRDMTYVKDAIKSAEDAGLIIYYDDEQGCAIGLPAVEPPERVYPDLLDLSDFPPYLEENSSLVRNIGKRHIRALLEH